MNPEQLTQGVLFTDQYQLSMAQVYFRMGLHERPAVFEHFFRRPPHYGQHQAGFCVAAGLDPFLDWMRAARFGSREIELLRAQRSPTGQQLFGDDFLGWLGRCGGFEALTIQAIPEGRVVHPHVPLTVVTGPLGMAQIVETALLNQLNFATLVATKAARVRESTGPDALVLEFGLRRAQGLAGNAATRAALIGGATRSSNVGMSLQLGLAPSGTHAHALVQAALALGMSELDAFRAFAEVYPDNAILLVDTVNTLESGIPNAITVFEELRRAGYRPLGVRLDSGDLAYLSIQAARMLDAAGFPDVAIVLSNDLDELVIWQILTQIGQEARRSGVDPDAVLRRLVFGVGTQLVTSWGAPALGGVYKLVALHDQGAWQPVLKLSETVEKTSNPGRKRAWRLYDERGYATADLIGRHDDDPTADPALVLRHPTDATASRTLRPGQVTLESLHDEVFAQGQLRRDPADLATLRARRAADVERLDPGVRRLINPHIYHVSLTQGLWDLKRELVARLRG